MTNIESASPAKRVARGSGRSARDADAIDTGELLSALRAFRRGDFSVRLPRSYRGVKGEIAEAFNDVVELNDRMTREFERLGETVGRQGQVNHRARLPAPPGARAAPVHPADP